MKLFELKELFKEAIDESLTEAGPAKRKKLLSKLKKKPLKKLVKKTTPLSYKPDPYAPSYPLKHPSLEIPSITRRPKAPWIPPEKPELPPEPVAEPEPIPEPEPTTLTVTPTAPPAPPRTSTATATGIPIEKPRRGDVVKFKTEILNKVPPSLRIKRGIVKDVKSDGNLVLVFYDVGASGIPTYTIYTIPSQNVDIYERKSDRTNTLLSTVENNWNRISKVELPPYPEIRSVVSAPSVQASQRSEKVEKGDLVRIKPEVMQNHHHTVNREVATVLKIKDINGVSYALILIKRPNRPEEYTCALNQLNVVEKGNSETLRAINVYLEARLRRLSSIEVIRRSQDDRIFINLDNSDIRDIKEISDPHKKDDPNDKPKPGDKKQLEKQLEDDIKKIFDTYKYTRKFPGDHSTNETIKRSALVSMIKECFITELNFRDLKPPKMKFHPDEDKEIDSIANSKNPFNAFHKALELGRHDERLWRIIQGSPFEREYRKKFSMAEAAEQEPSHFPSLSETLSAVERFVDKNQIVLDPQENPVSDADPKGVRHPFMVGGISYEQKKEHHYKIVSIKGKPTKKYLHVSIYRMPSGNYELTKYVL